MIGPDNRHFLDIADVAEDELRTIIASSMAMKASTKAGQRDRLLDGKILAMIFERPSTRTRVSFDVAMRQLGGEVIMLSDQEMQLGRGESVSDTAQILSRYVDAIMVRMLDHDAVIELAETATVPVINGLTRLSHPCQIMADLMTFEEKKGDIAGTTVTWMGDSNNVLKSWVDAAQKFSFKMRIASPVDLQPRAKLIEDAVKAGTDVIVSTNPEEMADGADCIVTDTWVSMGDDELVRRHNLLKPYQVNQRLMDCAKKDAIFMHCLPAHRGEEVTADVIDGPQSVVFDEAENRLHAQKGVLAWCFGVTK